MIGGKLIWTGLTIITALTVVWRGESANLAFVGAIIMLIGLILLWLDR